MSRIDRLAVVANTMHPMGIMRALACRRATLSLVVAAMLLRGLLPAGWMPNAHAAAGGAPLMPCHMMGTGHSMGGEQPASQNPKPAHDDGHRHDVCPFAAAPHLGSPATAPVLIPRSFDAAVVERFTSVTRAVLSDQFSPQSARAPPRIA